MPDKLVYLCRETLVYAYYITSSLANLQIYYRIVLICNTKIQVDSKLHIMVYPNSHQWGHMSISGYSL